MNDRKVELNSKLEKSRKRIVDVQSELDSLENRLSALPALQETERRFKQSGLENRIKEKSLLVKEERLFFELNERFQSYLTIRENLLESLPVDTTFVSDKALRDLPNSKLLMEIEGILDSLSAELSVVSDQYAEAMSNAEAAIDNLKIRWNEQRIVIEKNTKKFYGNFRNLKLMVRNLFQSARELNICCH